MCPGAGTALTVLTHAYSSLPCLVCWGSCMTLCGAGTPMMFGVLDDKESPGALMAQLCGPSMTQHAYASELASNST